MGWPVSIDSDKPLTFFVIGLDSLESTRLLSNAMSKDLGIVVGSPLESGAVNWARRRPARAR
jgi:hypothetical protein